MQIHTADFVPNMLTLFSPPRLTRFCKFQKLRIYIGFNEQLFWMYNPLKKYAKTDYSLFLILSGKPLL